MENTFKITLNNKRKGEVLTKHEFNFLKHLNREALNNTYSNRGALIKLQGKLERIWTEHLIIENQ